MGHLTSRIGQSLTRIGRRISGEYPAITGVDASDSRLQKALVNVPAAFCLFRRASDGWYSMPYSTPRLREIMGVEPGGIERSASSLRRRVHPEDLDRLLGAIETSAAAMTVWHEEFRALHPERGVVWIEGHFTPTAEEDGALEWSGFLTDITARRAGMPRAALAVPEEEAPDRMREVESRMRHTARMEAMGSLAAGVAHDFNNLLTVIAGNADLLHGEVADDSPAGHFVREIRLASERASSLTQQLLDFSRNEESVARRIDLNAAVYETARMLHRLVGENVRVELRLHAAASGVCIDPGHLTQILVNLAVNARDAMPDGGQFVIETRDVEMLGGRAPDAPATPGRFLLLIVRDTGVGMPAEVRARAFEPFFTTKPRGEGTGLGLSVLHGIVTQAGGFVDVASAAGTGTRFEIYLPTAVSGEPRAES